MKYLFFSVCLIFLLSNCVVKPETSFSAVSHLQAADYSNPDNWAALPSKRDEADRTPDPSMKDNQSTAAVDVFFLHPTTFIKNDKKNLWNASIDDIELNNKTDKSTILNQASIFNGAGKVYAPRYRQAHLAAYYTKDKATAKKALDFAYQDIKAAFEYYLQHYNHGRPIIIASHSQGTTHAGRLIDEFFDGKALQKKLVAAYLVGMPVKKDQFKNIKVCESKDEINCFCTWRTFKKGYKPPFHKKNANIVVTNPLSWTITNSYAPKSLNEGAVLRKFDQGLWKNLTDAQIYDGLLWVSKPKFPGSFLLVKKNYHIADYNLFYANVRANAILRAEKYLESSNNDMLLESGNK
ncbi:MAG TPA: DUF3089 domain-containing protein [Saprospiraceae bacterium]|nr:DUF3089 domain-containing protein [Saprospiraceae bacterium]